MKRILLLIAIIILINIPPLNWISGHDDILYSNANGRFTFDEVNMSGRNYELCLVNFEAYKKSHTKDTVLYRINKINILKFWRWGDYLTKEKYRLPYKSWETIEATR